MPRERPILGVQSMPLNPSSDTFIDVYVPCLGWSQNMMLQIDTGSCNSSVPYDPDCLAPYDPIGITWGMVPYDPDGTTWGLAIASICRNGPHPSHLFAETVLGASHLLMETVFSASHLFAETVLSASPLFAEHTSRTKKAPWTLWMDLEEIFGGDHMQQDL
ncbi:hypothetical protein BS47DRAFT_1363240 [Hydnum rufescens UP504]|uniref:Uncharacterized protein n=1 Tax=Hydnum rufescens UP504 TaxID=1448309 RepID=A0A9P6AUT3_9AGAM|nr:hypothetical protein BS47DRAFT_1363240 [Hydnum rufescens UP504]